MANPKSLNILVIDSDQFMVRIIQRLLGDIGYEAVVAAASGTIAAALMDQNDFDLVISDVNTPDMDGSCLMHHLGKMEQAPAVILMNGLDRMGIAGAEAVASDYQLTYLGSLNKPISGSALKTCIDTLLLNHTSCAPACQGMLSHQDIYDCFVEGRFNIVVQPIMSVENKAITGVEIFSRLVSPDGNIWGPDRFIPMAEECGLIAQLTDCLINEAFGVMKSWPKSAEALQVTLNISGHSLAQANFTDVFMAKIRALSIDPKRLILDVPETSLSGDAQQALTTIARLRAAGLHVAVDDFSSELTGLVHVKNSAVDMIKLDPSKAAGALKNGHIRRMLRSTIDADHTQGLWVVAEGVENHKVYDLLDEMNCDQVQGYYIAKPMKARNFMPWLKDFNLINTPLSGIKKSA